MGHKEIYIYFLLSFNHLILYIKIVPSAPIATPKERSGSNKALKTIKIAQNIANVSFCLFFNIFINYINFNLKKNK